MNDLRIADSSSRGMPSGTSSQYDIAGKYQFIAEIGRGGMSEVYLSIMQGQAGSFQKLVAMKLLRGDLVEDALSRRMFLEEGRVSAQLSHANIVQTLELGEDRGRYYIAMEYLDGQTYHRVRRASAGRRSLPLAIQLQMLVDMLAGLHYAHEVVDYDNVPMRLVHRDVTPSNILLTYDGQVKLLDFGIAKIAKAIDADHTKVGILKGKIRYMAAEQIAGRVVDRRADIYSVGVMLWEMLSGRDIWHGCTESEVLRNVGAGMIAPLPANTPESLAVICKKAMAHLPQERYETASSLRAALIAYLAQSAGQKSGHGLGDIVSELFQDHRLRIRQLIEEQIKSNRPRTEGLPPLLGSIPPGTSGGSMSDVGSTGPKVARTPTSHPQGAYNGKARSGMTRGLAIIMGVLGAAGAGVAALGLTRHRDAAATPPSQSASPTMQVAAPDNEPSTVAPAVRGVTTDTITLGMSAAFSGASRELGTRMKLGIETAFSLANEAGVEGRRIKLIALDDGYDAKRARANAEELIRDRKVFALIGNVGTPTAQEALPYVLSQKVLLFGALSGANLLRRDPPDRYVFNYRASYEEETMKMVGYLVDTKKVPDHGIVVFAQNDSYGNAGFEGATRMLRKRGRSDDLLRIGYDRNTLDVDDAVNKLLEYHDATTRIGAYDRPRHPVRAIIMVATYKAAAKFIQRVRDRKVDAMFLNVSFVGSGALAEELSERGPGYGAGVIVTQVVPHFDSGATGVIRYRDALKKYHPDQEPDFVSLEGFVVGQLFVEGVRRTGRDLDTEALVDTLEHLRDYDPALGGTLSFGVSQHQASHKVWGTVLDEKGAFKTLEME